MCTHNPECVRIRVCTRALVCRPMYTDVIYAYCYHDREDRPIAIQPPQCWD